MAARELSAAEARARREGVAEFGARGWAVRWIGAQVKAGRWGPGDVLPGERGLAKRIGVARETLRGALDQLEGARLLVRCGAQGRRRRFANRPPGQPEPPKTAGKPGAA